jgi:hypothetical protein
LAALPSDHLDGQERVIVGEVRDRQLDRVAALLLRGAEELGDRDRGLAHLDPLVELSQQLLRQLLERDVAGLGLVVLAEPVVRALDLDEPEPVAVVGGEVGVGRLRAGGGDLLLGEPRIAQRAVELALVVVLQPDALLLVLVLVPVARQHPARQRGVAHAGRCGGRPHALAARLRVCSVDPLQHAGDAGKRWVARARPERRGNR